MPKTLKSVSKQYTYNTNYILSPKRLESIIKVIESSRDNLNRSNVAHIVIWVGSVDFDKSVINRTLDKALRKELDTGYGYFLALEKSRGDGYHIHIMLTFSTGKHLPITVLKKAVDSLYSLILLIRLWLSLESMLLNVMDILNGLIELMEVKIISII